MSDPTNLTDLDLGLTAEGGPTLPAGVRYGGEATAPATPPANATTVQLALANASQAILTNVLAEGPGDMSLEEVVGRLVEDLRISASNNPRRFASDLQQLSGELMQKIGGSGEATPDTLPGFAEGIPSNPAGARQAALSGRAPRQQAAAASRAPGGVRPQPQRPDPGRIVTLAHQILAEKVRQDFGDYAHLIELTSTTRIDPEGHPVFSGELSVELTREVEVQNDDGTIEVVAEPHLQPLAHWDDVDLASLTEVYTAGVAAGVKKLNSLLASLATEDDE